MMSKLFNELCQMLCERFTVPMAALGLITDIFYIFEGNTTSFAVGFCFIFICYIYLMYLFIVFILDLLLNIILFIQVQQ